MLFNGSSTGPEPSGGNLTTQVDDILSNIIDEGLDDLNITEMALEDGKQDLIFILKYYNKFLQWFKEY